MIFSVTKLFINVNFIKENSLSYSADVPSWVVLLLLATLRHDLCHSLMPIFGTKDQTSICCVSRRYGFILFNQL